MTRNSSKHRSGALLLELVISGLVLGVILATAIPMLGWVARERKLSEQREAAILEVANLMERVGRLPWDDLTPERLTEFRPSPELLRQLPDARLSTAAEPDPADSRLKRVRIELHWESAPGKLAPPVKLAAWFADRTQRERHAAGDDAEKHGVRGGLKIEK